MESEERDWSKVLDLPGEEVVKKSLGLRFKENQYEIYDIEELIEQGELNKAKQRLEDLIPEKDYEKAEKHYLLAKVYHGLIEHYKAKEEIEKAVKLCPNNGYYQDEYAAILEVIRYDRNHRLTNLALKGPLFVAGLGRTLVDYCRFLLRKIIY